MLSFNLPIEKIQRVGPAHAKQLYKLNIKTLKDLFRHWPYRYDDFSKIISINQLKVGETATIQGKILEVKNKYAWRKKFTLTEALIQDTSGIVKAIWFNQPYLTSTLILSANFNFSGKFTQDKNGSYLSNPVCEKIFRQSDGTDNNNLTHTGRLVPIYPETKGVSSRWLRYLIKSLMPFLPSVNDYQPPEIKKSQKLCDLTYALKQIHFPNNQKTLQQAKRRLAFDEVFLLQLALLRQKNLLSKTPAASVPFNQNLIKQFVAGLPFQLTDAQKKAAWEIIQDLQKNRPMNRLLEGDVGSGKTIVAAIAALNACSAGYQVALMAPTEILAQQHFKTFIQLLGDAVLKIALLTGNQARIFESLDKGEDKNTQIQNIKPAQLRDQLAEGRINLLIGTHSLIQEKINFKHLALAIVDEQHRFGVEQRAILQKKYLKNDNCLPAMPLPHFLSITATPIPRTLILTVYGDLDISLLNETPAGRGKLITRIITPKDRPKIYQFIRGQIEKGRQAFIVCPRIENPAECLTLFETTENEQEIKNVRQEYEKLSQKIFSDLQVKMLHGRLSAKEKEKINQEFKDGKINMLVCTSIVEVGLDVPNATIIVIEGAERFGLAQLHQLRGRVCRGKQTAYCFLFPEKLDNDESLRLKAILECQNGFELAEKDLTLRGPGDFYGLRQWGLPANLTFASFNDLELIKTARQEAQRLLANDPELKKYPLLREKLKEFNPATHQE